MTKEKIAKLEQLSKSDFVKDITCGEFSEGYSRGKQWGEKYLAIEALEIINELQAELDLVKLDKE